MIQATPTLVPPPRTDDPRFRSRLLVLGFLFLSGCGGGGTAEAGSQLASPLPTPSPAPSPSPSPSPLPPPSTSACDAAIGRRLLVGPGRTYATPSAAAAAAQSGVVVVISAGDYVGDVAAWSVSNLTICGNGGRVRLFANGRHEGGKGIWVISGGNVMVENIEFHDAKVPDQNGAGIRAEGNGLTIRNCGFFDNEDGILGPDSGDLTIENSEFARNGYGDGQSHNLYVGRANKVTVV